MSNTETILYRWREGPLKAERLAGSILNIDGFSSLNPQATLGGADGLKDILCEKNGWRYVAAVYFPTTEKSFSDVKAKYEGDLVGVEQNTADGIVFVTNQHLTLGEQGILTKLAEEKDHKVIIYHLERLRLILDSPAGYGARLEFLGIQMTKEEQLSFFTQRDRLLTDSLQSFSTLIIRELSKKIDLAFSPQGSFGEQIQRIVSTTAHATISLMNTTLHQSNLITAGGLAPNNLTANLTVESLCLIHSALLIGSPPNIELGLLRTVKIWISGLSSNINDAAYVPPDPELVPELLNQLLEKWRTNYSRIKGSSRNEQVNAITVFHHELLKIHPFMDGNGRLARFVLAQQASELLQITRPITFEDRMPYYSALEAADKNDYGPLEKLVTQVIFGVEFICGSPCEMSGQQCPACRVGFLNLANDNMGVECDQCGIVIPAIEDSSIRNQTE